MPIPGSGTLRLRGKGDGRGLNKEVKGNVTDDNVSLKELSDDAGFSAPYKMSNFYGYTSCVAPSVSTSTSTSIGSGNFVAQGNLTNTGGDGCSITDHGFYIGTSTNYASNTKYSLGSKAGTGTFSYNISGLSSSTTYRVFAYAVNSIGESRGSMITTSTTLPSINIYIGSVSTGGINGLQACGGNSASGPYGDNYWTYGNCYSCGGSSGSPSVVGYAKIEGSGCEVSNNYGTTWSAAPYIEHHNQTGGAAAGVVFTGTFRWVFNSYHNYGYIRCTTCSPCFRAYLAKSGHQNYQLGCTSITGWYS